MVKVLIGRGKRSVRQGYYQNHLFKVCKKAGQCPQHNNTQDTLALLSCSLLTSDQYYPNLPSQQHNSKWPPSEHVNSNNKCEDIISRMSHIAYSEHEEYLRLRFTKIVRFNGAIVSYVTVILGYINKYIIVLKQQQYNAVATRHCHAPVGL